MGPYQQRFEVGDYVIFTAHEHDEVPFHCNDRMEHTLYGKVFLVKRVADNFGTQQVWIQTCELTDRPSECEMQWNFSAPMFELYTKDEEQKPFEMTFDDFCQEAQNA